MRLVHIGLALLVLASSCGIVLTRHYCQGELRSQALFITPESCHTSHSGQTTPPACPFHAKKSKETGDGKKGCCDNRSAVLKSDIPQWHKLPNLLHSLTAPLLPPLADVRECLYLLPASVLSYPNHWGNGLPPPKYGLHILLQVFRN